MIVKWLSLVGFGAFLVVYAIAGLRLVWLWRRTREWPELLIGAALLLYGPLAYGLVMVGRSLDTTPSGVSARLVFASVVCATAGAGCIYLFTWRIFRWHSLWARAALLAAVAVLLTSCAADIAHRAWGNIDGRGVAYWIASASRIGSFAWLTVESFAFWRRMRRRAALGLASPVLENRFLLWGLASGCGCLALAIWIAAQWWTGTSPVHLPRVNVVTSVLAIGAAVTNYLTFFAPAGYRRWVERRGAARAAASA